MLPSRTLCSVKAKLKNVDALIATGARDSSDLEKWRSRPWTAEETTLLFDIAQQGLTTAQVAGRLKRTIPSIETKYRKSRASNEAWPSFPTWTPQEVAELRLMRFAGFTMKGTAANLYRSVSRCEKQWELIRPRNADSSIQDIDGERRRRLRTRFWSHRCHAECRAQLACCTIVQMGRPLPYESTRSVLQSVPGSCL